MFVECPHCHTRIVPMTDDRCPSCQKNTKDLSGANLELTKVVINVRKPLPSICVLCGNPAKHEVKIVQSRRPPVNSDSAQFIGFFALLGWISVLFSVLSGHVKQKMLVRLPVCEQHRNEDCLRPQHADFDKFEMTFIVHRVFKDALSKNSNR